MHTPGSRISGASFRTSSFATLDFRKGVLTIQPLGPQIGEREATLISQQLHEALRETGRRLRGFVFDLTHVHSMSGMGLGMCIDAYKTAEALGARTAVVGLSPQIEDLFRMMKVTRLCTIARTRSELSRLLAA